MKSKVAVIHCSDYEPEKVLEAIEKGIDLLGGWETFVQKNEKLLLKPNLLNRAEPSRAVTTNPSVFQAVAKSLINEGYKNLSYGDSPGHPGNVEKTAEVCGIKEIADSLNIPIADFTQSRTTDFKRGRISRRFEISKGVLEADGIINICKMKTHQLERVTGAVKNMFGCVHGFNKGASHAKYPDSESFAQMLVDLNLLLPAKLHIMDGVVAMDGNGPASGNPYEMNLILISKDPVALDATFCRLIDLDPALVPTVYYGGAFGLGKWKEKDIEVVGIENLTDFIKTDFDVSKSKKMTGKWSFLNKLRAFSRKPFILKKSCISCGACVEACPVPEKAVFFKDKSKSHVNSDGVKNIPIFDYKKCIKCFCCQEMCPEKAIIVKRKLF